MQVIENKTYDEERALYAEHDLHLINIKFDGPADGESALKEAFNIVVEKAWCNLRYPFWHDHKLVIKDSTLSELCRAALWYSQDIKIENTKLYGIKAVRECMDIAIKDCDINSPEFGWFNRNIIMQDTKAQAEYFMLKSTNLKFDRVELKGKYSFQYVEDSEFDNCIFDTKDAFWHTKNVTVKNSVVKGEYLAWYAENLTFINCKISGTQPLCYCKNLKLIDCTFDESADLCFENSQVQAKILSPITSVKNPVTGRIEAQSIGELILDEHIWQPHDCKIELQKS